MSTPVETMILSVEINITFTSTGTCICNLKNAIFLFRNDTMLDENFFDNF